MGLYVHSLAEIPAGAERFYYLYLLDYGWEEPLGEAVRANLPRMAELASRSDAFVIHGPRGVHFENEVLSWHQVNGKDAKDILPAILFTTRHPSTFRESFQAKHTSKESRNALLLIPLRKICKSAQDVAELIQQVFEDIKDKKQLSRFAAAKRMKRGVAGALVDAVILQPKIGGIGFDVKKFFIGAKES
ncbi:MAG: hypothetical protein ABSD72_17180 [Terracidiphilus sp.]|jgi:hypothetical protein